MGVAGVAAQVVVQPQAAARRFIEGYEGLGVGLHALRRGLALAAVIDHGGTGAHGARSRDIELVVLEAPRRLAMVRVRVRVRVRVNLGHVPRAVDLVERLDSRCLA